MHSGKSVYALFIVLGILSIPISFYLGFLTGNFLRLEGPSQLYFALFVCSILIAVGLYAYKRSFPLALKGFVTSIAILLIF